jgi:citrate lyase subunit beta/citryl-CoA lyase
MDLRPEPSGEIHLMPYLMQRLITLANAAGVVPLGAWFRAPDRGLLATPENTYRAAFRGRTIGFKGCFCIQEEQVGPLNQGFTPTDFEVGAARSLLAAFDEALTQGSAATRWDDRIIDKGAAAQAQSLIALAAECAVRDEAKAAALEQRPVPAP